MMNLPPPQPLEPRRAPLSTALAIVLMLITAAICWNADEISADFRAWRLQALSAPRAFVACDPPTEFETLQITVVLREGRLAATCMYLGSRGSYSRRPVRTVAAK